MHLTRLVLCHYRNIVKIDMQPVPGFNVIWGQNAQGKTNLLEAIYLLGHLKSFRGAKTTELIQHGQPAAAIKAVTEVRQVSHQIGLKITPEGKSPQLNGKAVRKTSEFVGYLRPILFAPEEINLVKGYPVGRRALLDRAVFQEDPSYLERIQAYMKILRQRNCLLRDQAEPAAVLPWTEQLAIVGAKIRLERQALVQRLQPILQQIYDQVSEGRESANLEYPQGLADQKSEQEKLFHRLHQVGSRERQLGQTLAGPHRDDVKFLIDGRALKIYGSQGQQRSFLLAFKTAQIIDFKERLGEAPVLLLDDLTSELDQKRQAFFFEFLLARQGQVFITTTNTRNTLDREIKGAAYYQIANGDLADNTSK